MVGTKNALKWKRATIIFPNNHININKPGTKGIFPAYEKEGRPNMCFLLNDEYRRMWFKERQVYDKENYSNKEKAVSETKIKRRFVQRMMTNPKQIQKELRIIHMKQFQNIISKVDNRRTVEEKTKICQRYQKTMEPPNLTRYKPECQPSK